MRVGIIGTGAIARKHAQAYRNIGYEVTVCTNTSIAKGKQFASETGAEFVETSEEVCRDSRVDFVDVCTFPDFRLQPLELCAKVKKHILVQKPMATNLQTAAKMVDVASAAGIQLGVVSQHRFDESSQFLKRAIGEGRLGTILQADAYVKWYRSAEYYSRPIKGSWATEGGGALINQAIHQVDLLLFLIGAVDEVVGYWRLGALHKIESEDIVNALLRYSSGAVGVIQASTALWPGYPERVEITGTKGTAVITGDKLTTWDVLEDQGEPAPVASPGASGASDPMAISLAPFERQLRDFGEACMSGGVPGRAPGRAPGRPPMISGLDGYRALQVVTGIYESCRNGQKVELKAPVS